MDVHQRAAPKSVRPPGVTAAAKSGVSYFNGSPAVSGAAIVATKVIDARTIK
jgi:hypothetical protein